MAAQEIVEHLGSTLTTTRMVPLAAISARKPPLGERKHAEIA
ncbi:hypothetical protein [Mycolicibacterium sp. CH28]|nr:hypothetical protein [Mycolicibacterium sp. CH28]